MRTVRRLYFYAVALISLEVVVWGVIGLARNLFELLPGGGSVNVLASGLSLSLVGLPIFLLHWGLVQREAHHDDDERASRVRAVFFYAALIGLLIPVVQSALAVLNRLVLIGMGENSFNALVGGNQSTADNLISLITNLVAAFYISRELRRDWAAGTPGNDLAGVRRLYRYMWVLYSLILLVGGTRLVLGFIFYIPEGLNNAAAGALGNGLALVGVGLPLFLFTWLAVQSSLDQPAEQRSLLRLVFLYLLVLTSVVVALAETGPLAADLFARALGEVSALVDFANQNGARLATIIPFGILWAYFGRQLNAEMEALPGEPRRMGVRRLYNTLLALIGNVTTFFALQRILGVLVQMTLGQPAGFAALRSQLATALGALVVGLPLWLTAWRRVQIEAAALTGAGDHARRSVTRKGYLYLALFVTVLGAMGSAGWLLYLVFSQLLGSPSPDFAVEAGDWLATLLLVLVWLAYHLRVLRRDSALALRALGDRHARYPALILQDDRESFTLELVQALQRQAPRLPISVQRAAQGAPGDDLRAAKVVILPAGLAVQPGEPLRAWLENFTGQKVVVPLPSEDWVWLGGVSEDERALAQETAQAVRALAEGQDAPRRLPASPWAVAGYVLGGIFGLILLVMLVSLAISTIGR